MKRLVIPALLGVALLSRQQQKEANTIPKPGQRVQAKGTFTLNKSTKIIANKGDGAATTGKSVYSEILRANPSWMFVPGPAELLASTGGIGYSQIATIYPGVKPHSEGAFRHDFKAGMGNVTCRYIQMIAHSMAPCPSGHPAAGSPSWLFAHEILVE